MLGRLRAGLWVLVGIAALAGIWIATRPAPGPEVQSTDQPLASIGGPFTLTGGDGKPFSSSKLQGKPAAIFFGFTHCADVCPTTIARLTKLRRQLGKGDEGFAIIFISVDPERDRPEEVGRYAELFGSPVIGLTGSQAAIGQVKKQFGVYSAKVPQQGGDYSVDHTSTIFLLDRQGRFIATLAPEESDQVALDKLRRVAA
jgi:protein SCO1/2